MERTDIVRTRGFSFGIPALMDGMLGVVQTAVPLLAIRFGATAWFLGILGWTPQTVRLPFTLGAGMLSEKVGRTRVILPAASLAVVACVGLSVARNNTEILVLYILLMASIGAFYPALQAFIGDHSPRGELRKNLSAFNVGWTVGASLFALPAGYLLAANRVLPFAIGAALAFGTIQLVGAWSRTPVSGAGPVDQSAGPPGGEGGPGPLLLIARIGHFLGFFGLSMARYMFPKLGTSLGIREGEIGVLVGMMLVGQAVGIFAASAGPWWRGKLWPQLFAMVMALCSGLIVFAAGSKALFAAAFLIQGVSLGIAYTGALYYGLQARTNMGWNTGIHECLVAAGNILGALVGGAAAQFISLRAPYLALAGLSALAVLVTLVYWHATGRGRQPLTAAIIDSVNRR